MNIFDSLVERYDNWFYRHKKAYLNEISLYRSFTEDLKNGIEIGVGTGMFASKVGTEYGVDPSFGMLLKARARGINVIQGKGENLPFLDESFKYVSLIVTICFVENPLIVLKEAWRILNKGGKLFTGIIDKNSKWGKYYETIKNESPFYRFAKFYSVDEIIKMLKESNFKIEKIGQTLFSDYGNEVIEDWKYGYGKGSFVLIQSYK
jgi:Methylase involved in ubiquinone/menaquinone biosynthesis